MSTIVLNAKTAVMNFMKYLIQRRGKYSRRASFIVLSLLLFIPFQNCSQGTFKIEEADSSSVSKSSVNEPSNTAETVGTPSNNPPGTIAPVAPTEPGAPSGPVGPSAAQIQAEIDRKNRCKAGIKSPIMMNAAVVAAKEYNLKAGLAVGSGDVDDASSLNVTVDDDKGVSPLVNPADGCTFETRLQVALSMDPGKVSQFNSGIDASGAAVTIADVTGQRVTDRLAAAVEPRANNNNLNNGGATYANSNISLSFRNRQANMGIRSIRCTDGVAYYKLFIRVSTTNLNTVKVGYPASTNMANVSLESAPVYVRTNIANSCWKEQKLNNSIASIDSTKLPATNAKFGTSVAIDGDLAASLSEAEGGRGYIYLFRKSGVNWNFIQKVFAGNPNFTKLSRVALKGNLLAVSSSGDGLGYPGNVYLFDLSSGFAVASQTIKNPVTCSYPTTPCSRFGSSLALTGSSVIVGDMSAQVKGAAYLYVSNAGLYGVGVTGDRTPTATLLGTSLSGNTGFSNLEGLGANLVFQGNRAVVAAYNGTNSYKGSVHIFDVSGGTFAGGVSINAPSSISDQGKFGYSVAFDGTSLAVGAVDDAKATEVARGALIYYKDYTNLSSPFILSGTNDEDRFGVSLAMVGDSIYVGARGNTSGGGFISRHTRANLDAGNNSRSFLQLSHDQETGESFSYSLSVAEGALVPTVIVGAQTKSHFVNASDIRANAGAVYIYEIQ